MKPKKEEKKTKQLVLHQETIRNLSREDLQHVIGAGATQDPDCTQCTSPNPATCTRHIDA